MLSFNVGDERRAKACAARFRTSARSTGWATARRWRALCAFADSSQTGLHGKPYGSGGATDERPGLPCLGSRHSSSDGTSTVPNLTGSPLAAEGRTARRALNGDEMRDLGAGTQVAQCSCNARPAHSLLWRKADGERAANGRTARPRCLETRRLAACSEGANSRMQEERTGARPRPQCNAYYCLANWGPT